MDLCGLPAETHHDGPSLVPLLRDAESDWPHAAVTHLYTPGSYSVSGQRYRLVHYAEGGEELYDIEHDPYEWKNLIGTPAAAAEVSRLKQLAPAEFAEKKEPSLAALPALAWNSAGEKAIPPSRPDGGAFAVHFINSGDQVARLYWMSQTGERKHYADIRPGKEHSQRTRPGAVWLITNADDKPLGYFRVGDRSSKAVIPAGD